MLRPEPPSPPPPTWAAPWPRIRAFLPLRLRFSLAPEVSTVVAISSSCCLSAPVVGDAVTACGGGVPRAFALPP